VTDVNFTDDINIQFRATNPAGTTTGGITTYLYDNIAPTISDLVSPTTGQTFSIGNITLIWNPAIDSGIGISGYVYQVSTGASFDTFVTSGIVHST